MNVEKTSEKHVGFLFKHRLSSKFSILVALFIFLACATASAQNVQRKMITGTVTDQAGESIIGANVIEKGTSNGTITDIDGKFKIEVDSKGTIQVSFIGYTTFETPVGKQTNFTIKLQDDSQALSEVVVVGYGVQRKVTTSGAVSKVDGGELSKVVMPNAAKALQGQVSGLTIIDRGGAPGSDSPVIYLRGIGTTGTSSPLVLVDGVEMSLSAVPSSEIDNISVLKDAASASIYGSRAAHGVILVTTKKGKAGKINVSYNGSIGLQDRAMKPKQVSAREYMDMVNEALINSGKTKGKYLPEDIDITESGTDPYKHAYNVWPDEVFKSTYITEHNLSVNGGNENARYLVSFNYLDQPGLTANTNFERYNYRTSTELKINKYIKLSSDITYRHDDRLKPQKLGDALYRAWAMQPTSPIRYENGDYALDGQNLNAVSYTDLNVVGEERYVCDALFGQAKIDIEPLKDLVFTGLVSLNGLWDRQKIHYKNHKYYNEEGKLVTQNNNPNSVEDARNNRYELTLRFLANYKKQLGEDHNLSFLYGMEQISYRNYWSKAQRKDLISDDLPDVSLGSAASQFADGSPKQWGINSFFGRINYGFKDRYLFEANLRADGSSRFAKGHKWGVFPSFSAAWRVSEESFMKGLTFIDNLKLRASWGQTGNERIDEFMYLPQYGTENVIVNGTLSTAVRQTKMANPDITWETVEQTNIGLDFSMWNGQFFGEIDWYRKDTKDILLALGIPRFIGLDAPMQNAGVVRNSGIETMLGFRKSFKDFKLTTSVNFSYNDNKWVDRGSDERNINGWTIQAVGSPIHAFYIYQADGLIANEEELKEYKANHKSDPRGMAVLKAGDVKFVDTNHDGTIDAKDRQIYRPNIPAYTFGLNVNAEYKGFDLSLLFQGSAGGNQFLEKEYVEGPNYEVFTGIHFRDRWTETNQRGDASMPRLEAANNRNSSNYNSFFLQNCSYLRLKNAQLGYTLPATFVKKIGMNKLRVYVSGSNLLTFSGMFQGIDPEKENGRLDAYPTLRTINFGVNINF